MCFRLGQTCRTASEWNGRETADFNGLLRAFPACEAAICEVPNLGTVSLLPISLMCSIASTVRQGKTTRAGGSGLGLSIAQWIVRPYLATIRLESVLRRGTTFRVVVSRGSNEATDSTRIKSSLYSWDER